MNDRERAEPEVLVPDYPREWPGITYGILARLAIFIGVVISIGVGAVVLGYLWGFWLASVAVPFCGIILIWTLILSGDHLLVSIRSDLFGAVLHVGPDGLCWTRGALKSKHYPWSSVVSLSFGRTALRERSTLQRVGHAIASPLVTISMADGVRLRIPACANPVPDNGRGRSLIQALLHYGTQGGTDCIPKEDWVYLDDIASGKDLDAERAGCMLMIIPAFLTGTCLLCWWIAGEYMKMFDWTFILSGAIVLLSPVLIPLSKRFIRYINQRS